MTLRKIPAVLALLSIATVAAHAQKRVAVPAEDPGPPFYTVVQRLVDGTPFLFTDGEWVAIPFLREPSCVPASFDLLGLFDFEPAPEGPPRPFLCPLTVEGHVIWKNGPPPVDPAPIQQVLQGLGAVPVWFVRLSEVEAAVLDGDLTITELAAMPSLLVGYADVYNDVQQPGTVRPQGDGNGSIKITAMGTLTDGRSFFFQVVEMGKKGGGGVSYQRNLRISF
ncbi:MAG: hypothetical protein M3541_06950 [Acidobacteriota bacterium]|nr:hypothetical protein [Acidobacteriota bacterium]